MFIYRTPAGKSFIKSIIAGGPSRFGVRDRAEEESHIILQPCTGGLMIWSCLAMDEKRMEDLAKLGEVEWIVVPGEYHRMDCGVWKARFPNAKVVCAADSKATIEQVQAVDATYEEVFAEEARATTGVRALIPVEGVRTFYRETHLILDVDDGCVVLICDQLFNVKESANAGFMDRLIGSWIFGSIGPLGPTRLGRWVMTKDKRVASECVSSIPVKAGVPIKAIGVGHGDVITKGCEEALAAAAKRF
ncbi:unnamed protein product [Chrysoparadoxa australica]